MLHSWIIAVVKHFVLFCYLALHQCTNQVYVLEHSKPTLHKNTGCIFEESLEHTPPVRGCMLSLMAFAIDNDKCNG